MHSFPGSNVAVSHSVSPNGALIDDQVGLLSAARLEVYRQIKTPFCFHSMVLLGGLREKTETQQTRREDGRSLEEGAVNV